jgi:hypothetical protein
MCCGYRHNAHQVLRVRYTAAFTNTACFRTAHSPEPARVRSIKAWSSRHAPPSVLTSGTRTRCPSTTAKPVAVARVPAVSLVGVTTATGREEEPGRIQACSAACRRSAKYRPSRSATSARCSMSAPLTAATTSSAKAPTSVDIITNYISKHTANSLPISDATSSAHTQPVSGCTQHITELAHREPRWVDDGWGDVSRGTHGDGSDGSQLQQRNKNALGQ